MIVNGKRGDDLRYNLEITLEEAYAGKATVIRFPTLVKCETCSGSGVKASTLCGTCNGLGRTNRERALNVNIPPGVEDGTRIRFTGEGEAGLRGGPDGDLYIFLSIATHALFERDGADLQLRAPISVTKAIVGGEFEVPTIDGSKIRVTIPEGTQSGRRFRLPGKGMPVPRSQRVGDMYVTVAVV